MARIRTIKPEFFSSEDIVSLSPMARLLYIGLWCEADKLGRLEWKPGTFKLRYFPSDACSIVELAEELTRRGLVVLYGEGFAYIPSFKKHQHINPRESDSTIPAPPERSIPRVTDASMHVPNAQGGREGKGREGNLNSLLTQAPARQAEPAPAPAPLKLVEDGPEDPEDPSDPPLPEPVPLHLACPHVDLLALWAEVLPAMPRHLPSQWRGTRGDHLRARWRETAIEKSWQRKEDGIAYFRKLFEFVGRSRFLTGRSPARDGKRPFVVELEWLVNPTNWAKTIEGKYHEDDAA